MDERRWRCQVCTFVSTFNFDACKRCHEPVSEEDKIKLELKVVQYPKQGQSSSFKGSRKNVNSKATCTVNNSKTRSSNSKEGSKIHQFKKKTSKVNIRPKDDFHKGDLGYKAKRSNVATFTASKLHQATAAYSAKYEKGDGKDQKGGNIHTIGSTKVNGFTKSSAAVKAERERKNQFTTESPKMKTKYYSKHDETAAPKPAKYMGKGADPGYKNSTAVDRAGGLIGYLQAAANPNAYVASQKKQNVRKKGIVAQTKSIGGKASKLAL